MLPSHDEGIPILNGMYVAYVNPKINIPYAEKILLMFQDGKWFYCGSDQQYRDHVYMCYGPLPSLELT